VTQIKTYSWDNAQVILVGNKCDMEDERVISYERGKQLAEQLGIEFFETSAKENINVKVTCQKNSSLLSLFVQGKHIRFILDLRSSQWWL
jgi:GTPase SAR1 family protein